eukprot:4593463-Karenia_brevis.AAC.1
MLPILYKIFSKVLCARVEPYLLAKQSVDQAGFTSGFNCDDNLLAIILLMEKCREFRLPLWIAAVDFRKAFDT